MKKILFLLIMVAFSCLAITNAQAFSMLKKSGNSNSSEKKTQTNGQSDEFDGWSYHPQYVHIMDTDEPSYSITRFDEQDPQDHHERNNDDHKGPFPGQDRDRNNDNDRDHTPFDHYRPYDPLPENNITQENISEFDPSAAATPEPASITLLAVGLAGLAARGFGKR